MIDFFRGKYRFLSNFYLTPVMLGNVTYDSVEHSFQAHKTTNLKLRRFIAKASSCAEAKEFGNCMRLPDDWYEERIPIMKRLVKSKFQNPELKKMLLDTGDQELVEGNTWNDVFWGMCRGEGENNLGKILMEVRQELRDEQRTTEEL